MPFTRDFWRNRNHMVALFKQVLPDSLDDGFIARTYQRDSASGVKTSARNIGLSSSFLPAVLQSVRQT